MSEQLNNQAQEQHEIPHGEAGLAVRSDLKETLEGLPVLSVGQEDPFNPDRSLGFPHVLYHGSKDENFTLDDTRNHRNSSVGTGARTGKGIYVASEAVSKNFGEGTLIEFVPHNANLLDLSAAQAREPLPDTFKQGYLEDFTQNAAVKITERFPDIEPAVVESLLEDFKASENYATKQDLVVALKNLDPSDSADFNTRQKYRGLIKEAAAQVNTARMISELEDVSLRELFATHDSVNGHSRMAKDIAFDVAPLIDFLTAQGIDGAITVQEFNTQTAKENGVVFWKLDNIGDKETWKRRRVTMPKVVGSTALEAADVVADLAMESTSIWVAKEGGGWERQKIQKPEKSEKPKFSDWERAEGGGWKRTKISS